MPSKTEKQRRLMGMALAYKQGELKNASDEVKKLADSMSSKQLEDFAKKPLKEDLKESMRDILWRNRKGVD